MAARSQTIDKLTTMFSFRVSDVQSRAVHEIARLDGVTAGELLRKFIDREWAERAEDLKRVREVFADVRKKKRAA